MIEKKELKEKTKAKIWKDVRKINSTNQAAVTKVSYGFNWRSY